MVKRFKLRRLPAGSLHLVVTLTGRHVRAQVVDKNAGVVRAYVGTEMEQMRRILYDNDMSQRNLTSYKTASVTAAKLVGKTLADKCKDEEITELRFDRPSQFVGKLKALVDEVTAVGIKLI